MLASQSTRRAEIERTTKETQISLTLDLDGGEIEIATGVAFFDHMLDAFAKHSGCGLRLRAKGDGMDHHHLVEDVGIALGRAIAQALGEKRGIERFGDALVPLDDALVLAAVDLSGRSYLNFDVPFAVEDLADLKTELVGEFFRALSDNGKLNLHLVRQHGKVAHHLCEASFKAFARAFRAAKRLTGTAEVPSTKGVLE
ncbi:MAG TPA: imidazoleglycerol-phosphate dehydratase HisB [Candidatus Dormibacteraeota bacterium]|nr:imidazoleglycerol-phosphate dehydratase HisB [Candidatus Dormibacteraeota bacterium]